MDIIHLAFVPTKDELEKFLALESTMSTSSGMPLVNRALEDARERTCHVIILQKGLMKHPPFHTMTMIDTLGNTVGFDVPDNLRHEVEGRDDLVWLSDDFVMDPNLCMGEVSMVLHSCPVSEFDDLPDVADMVLMFPATPVDELIRETYGVPKTREFNSAILSFNEKK